MESSVAIPQTIKIRTILSSSNPTSGYVLRKLSHYLKEIAIFLDIQYSLRCSILRDGRHHQQHIYIDMYIYIHLYMYVYVHIHIYKIYIHIHIYAHTYIQWNTT